MTFSKELSHVEIDFDMDYIRNIEWKERLVSKIPEHLQIAYDAGYTDAHLKTSFSEEMFFGDCPDFIDPIFDHFPNPHLIRATFRLNKPGSMLKKHKDHVAHLKYQKIWKDKGIDVDINNFRRAIIFCEDHKDGHFSLVEDSLFYNWKAGDYVFWGLDYHAAGNVGKENRYVLAVDYVV